MLNCLKQMKILIILNSFPPKINSAARLYSDLSKFLSEQGHDVTVLTSRPTEEDVVDWSDEYYKTRRGRSFRNGIRVIRVPPHFNFFSRIIGGKAMRFAQSCLFFIIGGIFIKRHDVILIYSPPLFLGIAGYFISKIKRSHYIINIQDIHPKVLIDAGIVQSPLMKYILLSMETFNYSNAKSLIVYSAGNKKYLVDKNINKDKITVIPNWVDTNLVQPVEKMNAFRGELELEKKFVVMYAGSLTSAQQPEIIVKAAALLKDHNEIRFCIVGDGTSKPELHKLIADHKLINVCLLPVQTGEKYFGVLNASDVCLLPLNKDIPPQTVPGKLAEIMACGKPVIASVDLTGDAAKIIENAVCGYNVAAGDALGLSLAILKMYNNRDALKVMGDNARQFALQEYSRDVCLKKFERLLFSVLGPSGNCD